MHTAIEKDMLPSITLQETYSGMSSLDADSNADVVPCRTHIIALEGPEGRDDL